MVAAVANEGGGLESWADWFKKDYRRPIFFCALISIAPVAYGYDGTYFTSLLETPVFGKYLLIFRLQKPKERVLTGCQS